MKNKMGFIPLLIPLIIVALGIGATVTYQNSEAVQNALPVKQFLEQKESEQNQSKLSTQNQEQELNQNKEMLQTKNSNCQDSDLHTIKISEDMANDFLSTKISNYEYAGYSINNGNVKFSNNAINANVTTNNGASLSAVVVPTDNGKSFAITNVQNPEGSLSSIQMVGINLMLGKANNLIWNYVPSEYAKKFSHFIVSEGEMEIFFYADNCINETN